MIKLRAASDDHENVIWVEPEVMASLLEFAKQVWTIPKDGGE